MWVGYFGPHKRVWLLLLLLLSSVLFLVTEATVRRLSTHGSQGQLQTLLHASLESSKESVGGEMRHRGLVNGGKIEESSTLGSRPPSCEHKCGGCVPCLAIQVPTAMDRVELHYSNYEPEGWKCKCGSTFFNP